jgi:hypothetical protein
VGALEEAALAMAIPAPTNATAPVVATTLFQSFIASPPFFPFVRGSFVALSWLARGDQAVGPDGEHQ